MKILAIDSASKCASVCVMDNGNIISEFFLNNRLTHSQTLMPMIKNVLDVSETNINDIDLFAVSTGPGSFTGVRIGVSTVKGMALPWNKPCVSVSTLEAMAYNFLHIDCIVCATMDARCQQVYNAMFELKNKKIFRITDDRAISVNSLLHEFDNYDKKIFLVGDGAYICYNNLCEKSEKFELASELLMYQRASSIAIAAMNKYESGDTTDAISLNPAYLRPSQAQRELENRSVKK